MNKLKKKQKTAETGMQGKFSELVSPSIRESDSFPVWDFLYCFDIVLKSYVNQQRCTFARHCDDCLWVIEAGSKRQQEQTKYNCAIGLALEYKSWKQNPKYSCIHY